MPAVLGLDLGGTVIKAGVVDEHGTVQNHRTAPSAEGRGVEGWIRAVTALAHDALASSEVTPVAVGVSVPGAVDAPTGTVLDLVARLDVGDGACLPELLSGLGLPVHVDNDARAALAAERAWGAARGIEDVVLLTLGTGLGGAALVGGRPPGTRPLSGNQVGHFVIDVDGPECVCGGRGCAETFVSATGLLRLAAQEGAPAEDPAAVFLAAKGGDAASRRAVDAFTAALTAVVITSVHAYQPELVVLGGGLMGSQAHFLARVQQDVRSRAWTHPRDGVRVTATTLHGHLGVAGAAAVALARTADLPNHQSTSRRAS